MTQNNSVQVSLFKGKERFTLQAFIFDLDDTLMDTYGQLVARAHEEACLAMQAQGLEIPFSDLLNTRLHLAKAHPRQNINVLLAQHFGCHDPRVIEAGHYAYFNTEIKDIQLFPGVRELLEELQQDYHLFLVTSGFYQTQQKKVEILALEALFTEITYVSLGDPMGKRDAFQKIQHDYALAPQTIAAVGDRVHGEIAAANQLGFHTIWLKYGEFSHVEPELPEEIPHFTIQDICELPQIIRHIETYHCVKP